MEGLHGGAVAYQVSMVARVVALCYWGMQIGGFHGRAVLFGNGSVGFHCGPVLLWSLPGGADWRVVCLCWGMWLEGSMGTRCCCRISLRLCLVAGGGAMRKCTPRVANRFVIGRLRLGLAGRFGAL